MNKRRKQGYIKTERFIEEDYLIRKRLVDKEYISADYLMKTSISGCDLTFKFFKNQEGFMADIYDNNTEEQIMSDQLNKNARDYYTRQLGELAEKRIKNLVAI